MPCESGVLRSLLWTKASPAFTLTDSFECRAFRHEICKVKVSYAYNSPAKEHEMSPIKVDTVVQQQLEARGITEKTGVFGEHKVQLGQGEPILLDRIKANKIPHQGFKTATKVARGKDGVTTSVNDALHALCRPGGKLDAKALLSALKTTQEYMNRLDRLGQLTPEQKENALWAFAPSVENLSNAELAAVYQAFTSGEMDVLQTALMREGRVNAQAKDARSIASALFDLQALVLKEVSNRSVRGMVDDLIRQNPADQELQELRLPPRLSEQYGGDAAITPAQPNDITPANLRTLVETAAESATTREKTAAQESARLQRRGLPSVSVHDMADVLRSAELTININVDVLLAEDGPLSTPDTPMKNIFHLAQENIMLKGEGYLAQRDAAERLLFPELEGHGVRPDERPLYGALNIQQRGIGAVSASANYGTAAIVLKPETARRATYIADDTFFAPVVNFSQSRRDDFYALLDGAGLPADFVAACRNENSVEHKALEDWFNTLAKVPDGRTGLFKNLPQEVTLQEDDASRFTALLTQCFGDKDATRKLMATHDNLEALIPNMTDFDGNALALAAMKKADGAPRVLLTGAQYIEAQIQGPLVPSRDIAEIRIDLLDIPRAQRDEVRERMAAFEARTGIHVNLIENYNLDKDVMGITRAYEEEKDFHLQHLDKPQIREIFTDILSNIDENVADYVSEHPELTAGIPEGALRLEGNALNTLAAKFQQALSGSMKTETSAALDPQILVQNAFKKALDPILKQKATLLRELEQLPFATAAQKEAFTHWVRSARAIRSPEEMRIIHTYATEQAALLRKLADAEPPVSAEEVARRTSDMMKRAAADLNEFIATLKDSDFGPDDKNTELDRISFMSLAFLEHGEPAMDKAGMARLYERLNSPEQQQLRSQLCQIGIRPDDVAMTKSDDFAVLSSTVLMMQRNAQNLATVAGVKYEEAPMFEGELSLLGPTLRRTVQTIAPEIAAILERTHPGYPPFPAPAHPEAMPANGAARREFLVHNLDAYIQHEQTFERGTSVHGRGHIARAFIYACAMCTMLEEQGLSLDRNAVLCGITGHDLGRQGGGQDQWEGRSADMTVDSMRASFGDDAMGQDYEQAVRDSIDAHRGQTLEAMLLNAADSLDIGRTQEFDPDRFAFLHGKAGEVPSEKAQHIRRQLAVEADLLQRLTNPLCQYRQVMNKLVEQAVENRGPLSDMFMQQHQAIRNSIRDAFAAEWTMGAEAFMQSIEKAISDHPDMFPLLSQYYKP